MLQRPNIFVYSEVTKPSPLWQLSLVCIIKWKILSGSPSKNSPAAAEIFLEQVMATVKLIQRQWREFHGADNFHIPHCVKSVQIQSFLCSVFSCMRTEHGDLRSKISVFSLNTGKYGPEKNSVLGNFHAVLADEKKVCNHHYLTQQYRDLAHSKCNFNYHIDTTRIRIPFAIYEKI